MHISIIGIGMGSVDTLTMAGYKALNKAELIIGAKRIISSLPDEVSAPKYEAIAPKDIADIINKHSEAKQACIVFSGDIGFYSGATKLRELLAEHEVENICGITTVQYFAAKLGEPWQNAKLVSAHGVECNVLGEVLTSRQIFFLTGGKITPQSIINEISNSGLGDTFIAVGENLSYPDEKITVGTANSLKGKEFAPLSAVWVEREAENSFSIGTAGIEDAQFIRGDVPMTKQEVRSVICGKLGAKNGDIIYDVGAGTGSVSVELALLYPLSKVYSVEVNSEAIKLIEENRIRFSAYNISLVAGKAPDALESLPSPDVAFIGGSKGNMKEILKALKEKNPYARVVVSAIAIETLAEALNTCKALEFNNIEVTQVAVSKTKPVGKYNMLMGQNPIFLISAGGRM